ncbi:MAG: SPOR domain-containing protein [Deltaproteobacteria bacterium]|nr:SPOR domain-containing protein [Deltaproteobacteria bacterium]
MRLGHLILSILLCSLLSLAGCSEKKSVNTPVSKKTVVRRPITPPPEEKAAALNTVVEKDIPTIEEEKTDEMKDAEEERFYIAGGGETLLMIAAREDVYGNPHKWLLIYQLNRDLFNDINKDESFADKFVPAETRLLISEPLATEKAADSGSGERWVVNVLSSTEGEKIEPNAIRLVDNGYYAYITVANVKGDDYTRLRVGFYDDRSTAEEDAKKISEILNVSDVWTTTADESEFNEYGGYK